MLAVLLDGGSPEHACWPLQEHMGAGHCQQMLPGEVAAAENHLHQAAEGIQTGVREVSGQRKFADVRS